VLENVLTPVAAVDSVLAAGESASEVPGNLLLAVASILVLGLGVQLIARRLQVPSVVFYLALGILLGPVFEFITLEGTFGSVERLQPIVGVAVAIIVFDGAFALQFDRIREAGSVALRLVTVGAILMFVGMSAATHFLVGADWNVSFVVGALLVATGPTVVTPILEVVRVREHVASALETEGIINDVTAAIAAAVIFETMVLHDDPLADTLIMFAEKLGIGLGVGLVAAGAVYALIQLEITPGDAVRGNQFLALAGAVGGYAAASTLTAEGGVMAAATAGIVLGNLDLTHRHEIEEFARNATLVVLAFVFVAIAALIDLDAIRELGPDAVLLALAAIVVVRPLLVVLSTVGAKRFSWRERTFIAGVGPRGIIPASVATLFAIELQEAEGIAGAGEASRLLQAAVFAVILATVATQAGFARQIADALKVSPMKTIIAGGGRVGRALAERLEKRGEFVVVVEDDDDRIESLRSAGFTVYRGDASETSELRDAGADEAKRVIAATGDDDVNLLVSQTARTKFGVTDVYARVNDPSNVDAFDSMDVTAIDSTFATATAIDDEIQRPALAHWMNEVGEGHDVQEIEVTADDLVDKSIEEVNAAMPDGCIVAAVSHNGESHVPSADYVLHDGERITFVGDTDAVRGAIDRFHPHD
jgi:NhaP-type Na+/H+ or K+/H+ antiporter